MHKIILQVEYLAPMARVAKFTENDPARWRNLLTPTVTSDTFRTRPHQRGFKCLRIRFTENASIDPRPHYRIQGVSDRPT